MTYYESNEDSKGLTFVELATKGQAPKVRPRIFWKKVLLNLPESQSSKSPVLLWKVMPRI